MENIPVKEEKITASTSMLPDQERWPWLQKVFRDKVTPWPKIRPKDSVEIIEFLDFL